VHYTIGPTTFFFSWLTATVEPFFPTPPARMTDMLLCASKIAMPTAAHNGNTFTSVPVYGNCIRATWKIFWLVIRIKVFLTLRIPDMLIIIYKREVTNQEYICYFHFWNNFVLHFNVVLITFYNATTKLI